MITASELRASVSAGGNAIDPDGNVIGSLNETITGESEDRALWAAVTTGLLGRHEPFLPIGNGTVQGQRPATPKRTGT